MAVKGCSDGLPGARPCHMAGPKGQSYTLDTRSQYPWSLRWQDKRSGLFGEGIPIARPITRMRVTLSRFLSDPDLRFQLDVEVPQLEVGGRTLQGKAVRKSLGYAGQVARRMPQARMQD